MRICVPVFRILAPRFEGCHMILNVVGIFDSLCRLLDKFRFLHHYSVSHLTQSSTFARHCGAYLLALEDFRFNFITFFSSLSSLIMH